MWSFLLFLPLPMASSSNRLDLAEKSCASMNVHTASIGIRYSTLSVTYATVHDGPSMTTEMTIKSRIGVGPRSYPLSFFIGFGLRSQSSLAIRYALIPLLVGLYGYAFSSVHYFPTSRSLHTSSKYHYNQTYKYTNNCILVGCDQCRCKKLIPRKPW